MAVIELQGLQAQVALLTERMDHMAAKVSAMHFTHEFCDKLEYEIAVATPSPAADRWLSKCRHDDIKAVATNSAAAACHGRDRTATSSGLGGASQAPQVQPRSAASLGAKNGSRAGTKER